MQARHHAGEADDAVLAGRNLDKFVSRVAGPLARAPGRLAVDQHAEGGRGGRLLVHEVHQRSAGFDGGLEAGQLKGAQNAAAGVELGRVQGRLDDDVLALGLREHGKRIFLGLGGGFGFRLLPGLQFGLLLRGFLDLLGIRPVDPAHAFAEPGPANDDEQAQYDGEYEIFAVLHENFLCGAPLFSARRGNGIVARATPGMAPADPLDGKPAATEEAVRHDGLHRVFRTGRKVAAGWRKQRGDEALVEAQRQDGDGAKRAAHGAALRERQRSRTGLSSAAASAGQSRSTPVWRLATTTKRAGTGNPRR